MARGFVAWSVILGTGVLVVGAACASVVSMVTRLTPPAFPWGSGSGTTLELAHQGMLLHLLSRWPVALVAGPLLALCLRRPGVLALVAFAIPLASEAASAAWAIAVDLRAWRGTMPAGEWIAASRVALLHPLVSAGWLRLLATSGATAMLAGLATTSWATWCLRTEQEHARVATGARPTAWWQARHAPAVPSDAGRWIATAYGVAFVLAAAVLVGQRALLPEWSIPPDSDVILVDENWQEVKPHFALVVLGLAAHVLAGAWLIRWGTRRRPVPAPQPLEDPGRLP